MIRNKKEYEESRERLEQGARFLTQQEVEFAKLGLTPAEIARATAPTRSFQAQIEDDLRWYERARGADFSALQGLADLGRLLVALRIAKRWTQRQLAERLEVSEAQVSRDERNEYHGITVERAQRVLDALEVSITTQVESPRHVELKQSAFDQRPSRGNLRLPPRADPR